MGLEKTGALVGLAIGVRGTVQGVGFRPFVFRLAQELGVKGEVGNDGAGVYINAWAPPEVLDAFLLRIQENNLPLARVAKISKHPLKFSAACPDAFTIAESTASTIFAAVSVDAATCPDCLQDLNDPQNRRYKYPFVNCTNCGPRLSILKALPYDRSNTCMSAFELCAACKQEYLNPADRRFHAEPNACPRCGPHLFVNADGLRADSENPALVAEIVSRIKEGALLALKGLGGFHLICDASNGEAVSRLREKKHRFKKPLALMAKDISTVERYCYVNAEEKKLLCSPQAPILILPLKALCDLSGDLAPAQSNLGFMLPYTPLHHMIMQNLDAPVVCTSANISEEPQCISNEDAEARLNSIAEFFVFHNRDIVNRVDDSVLRFMHASPLMLRRARGYSPLPSSLPFDLKPNVQILAMGAELKNTFCLVKGSNAILSQHIGDLKDARTFDDYIKNIALHEGLYEHHASDIAVDMHPDYLSTKLGCDLAEKYGARIHQVQHHHAHIAACLLENSWELEAGPVLGIALDGLGFGADNSFWGAEFLLTSYAEFKRVGRLKPAALIGGAQAMKEPWRNTYAQLKAFVGWDEFTQNFAELDLARFLRTKPLPLFEAMLEKNTNVAPASSCGRLFDAVAAALGICREQADYEGQAAIELESIASAYSASCEPYLFALSKNQEEGLSEIDPAPMWQRLLWDLKHNADVSLISARFHYGLARIVVELAMQIVKDSGTGLRTVAISGGVFQNKILFEEVSRLFEQFEIKVLAPSMVPANDGGISFGQAAVCAARLRKL